MSGIPSFEQRIATILFSVAEEMRICDKCGACVAVVNPKYGPLTEYDIQGLEHCHTTDVKTEAAG